MADLVGGVIVPDDVTEWDASDTRPATQITLELILPVSPTSRLPEQPRLRGVGCPRINEGAMELSFLQQGPHIVGRGIKESSRGVSAQEDLMLHPLVKGLQLLCGWDAEAKLPCAEVTAID